jgi:hypothetical protein
MFYIFWGFSNDLPYFGYNSEEQEIPTLCIFLLSGTYTGQIELGIFRGLIFCEDEHSAVLELCKRRSEGNKSPGGARPTSGCAT